MSYTTTADLHNGQFHKISVGVPPIEHVLPLLQKHRRCGSGWSARCPAHEDRRASLSIGVGDDGRVLLRCHTGCTIEAICQALGLEPRDLFPQQSNGPTRPRRQMPHARSAASEPQLFASTVEAIDALERKLGRYSDLWRYCDAEGEYVGAVIRWDGPDGKMIRPIARRGDAWIIGAMPEPRPLYKLPELANAESVLVVEGEKTADAAIGLGFVATTSAGGSQAPHQSDWTPLAGKSVLILPDNDAAGRAYAETVANILTALNPPAVVKVIDLAKHAHGLPKGGDLADIVIDPSWCGLPLRKSATAEDLRAWIERLAGETKPWHNETAPGPIITCLADIEPREISWLWPGRLPLGRISMLVGKPGEGKSFLTCDLAARISRGENWPDRAANQSGSVLLLTAEDDPADTIRPRLDAHGADCRRISLLRAVRQVDEDGERLERLITLADVGCIESALRRMPDCRLVVIDPIGAYLGGGTDAHRDNEVRSVLAPIASLAERYGPAVLVVAHRRKSAGTHADDLALGSRAFTGIARAVWHLSRDPENGKRRLLLPGKNNLADEGAGLAFTIGGCPPRLLWEPDPVRMNADEGLAAELVGQGRPGPEAESLREAVEFVKTALENGPRPARDVEDEWSKGHCGSTRTLRRAKKAALVEAYRPGGIGPWFWRLPNLAT